MTQPDERYRALTMSKKLLEELCDPGKTPRVPGIVRDRARNALRHFPTDWDLQKIAIDCPELLDTHTISVYNKNNVHRGTL
jgi:hypothetical protein